MPIFFSDPFDSKKRLRIKPNDNQLMKMIEAGIENYKIESFGENRSISVPDSFWTRRKLKKLKIQFKR